MAPVAISEIETARLLLRGAISADVEPLAAFNADPAFTRYIPQIDARADASRVR